MKTSPSSTAAGNGQSAMKYNSLRMGNFLLTLGIMVLSFVFYSLGLFGEVEGPLTPARLGDTLAALGVTKRHIVALLLAASFFSAIWNRLFNALYRKMGARLVCTHKETEQGPTCGAAVKREEVVRHHQQVRIRYVCGKGHRCRQPDFKTFEKGPVSRSIALCSIVFLAAIFLS
jgi:hypothetical protein